MELTIAGRYMVYAPTGEGVGVSRRLEDKERDRLRKEAKQLDLGGGGAIIRTAAHGATRADFERELQYLFKLNEVLQRRVEDTPAPALVFQEADLSVRVVRDIFSEHFERAIVDDEGQHHRLTSFFSRTAPELVDRVELYDEQADDPLFEAYGVDPVINGMLERRVDLPSGGYLIIDYAEALTVIDVNTGSFTGKGKSARLEDTITKTNLEAADEVVRQLRLRDIGGIIVIDFIDMARSRNREAVLKVLRKALDEDRTKTFVVEISPLGLVEMTRQNVTDGVREIMTKPCPVCSGEGVVKSEETIAIEFARHLRHMALEAGSEGPEAYLLRINPKVTAWFIADSARELHELEHETGKYFHFEGSDGLPLDHFAVTMEGTRAEIEEHAVPFRAGEEVHVNLVEPHMYNDDDAVAKVDGYLIDVVNGVLFVGEKKLVRIEEAGRTIARAVLVGADAEVADEAATERATTREKALVASRRSAAAKRGAAKRREREDDAVTTLVDQDPVEASTAPAAEEDSDQPRKRRRRRGGRGPWRGRRAATAPRRRRPTPTARPTTESESEVGVPEAEAPAEATVAEAAVDDGPPTPKPRARRRRAAAADAEPRRPSSPSRSPSPRPRTRRPRRSRAGAPASARPTAEDAEAAVEARDAVAEEPAEETPKPRGRTRKRPAAEAEAEVVPEAEEAPKPAPKRKRKPKAEPVVEAAPEEPAEEADEEGEDDDTLSSRPRRRGRRGGRRRSRASAQADAELTD